MSEAEMLKAVFVINIMEVGLFLGVMVGLIINKWS